MKKGNRTVILVIRKYCMKWKIQKKANFFYRHVFLLSKCRKGSSLLSQQTSVSSMRSNNLLQAKFKGKVYTVNFNCTLVSMLISLN